MVLMFGVPNTLMSDGPSLLKYETILLASKDLKFTHHFTLAYCSWNNGAVERLEREVLRFLRATLSELKMNLKERPDVIPNVQAVLNNSPSPRRGNICPFTAFMGRQATPPIKTFLRSTSAKTVTLTEAQAESYKNVEELIKVWADLHPRVQYSLAMNQKQGGDAASRGQLSNLAKGDYVLVARSDFHAGEKCASAGADRAE